MQVKCFPFYKLTTGSLNLHGHIIPYRISGLQFLVRLHKDMGLPEADDYLLRLKKAEKIREAREQRVISASSRQSINAGEGLDNISGGITLLEKNAIFF